jgi:uncharacterized coiled-coil protein SlyX
MTDDPNDTDQDNPGRLRRMYEETAEREATASARVAELERREAFRDSGLDLQNPLHRVVAESYSGELDSEKVRAHVDSLGLKTEQAQQTPPPPQTSPEERAAIERITNAGAGDGLPATEPDRVENLKRDLEAAARRGNIQDMDRISTELARAMGNPIVGE